MLLLGPLVIQATDDHSPWKILAKQALSCYAPCRRRRSFSTGLDPLSASAVANQETGRHRRRLYLSLAAPPSVDWLRWTLTRKLKRGNDNKRTATIPTAASKTMQENRMELKRPCCVLYGEARAPGSDAKQLSTERRLGVRPSKELRKRRSVCFSFVYGGKERRS